MRYGRPWLRAKVAYLSLSQGTRTHSFRPRSNSQVSLFSHKNSRTHSGPRLLQSGRVTPVVYSEVYPLEHLAEGLVGLETRKTWGKVVVRVKDEPGPAAKL